MRVVIDSKNVKWYYDDDGVSHRTDGPAIIWPDGEKRFIEYGRWSTRQGPASIAANGEITWIHSNIRHRSNGPAWDYPNGYKTWVYNGTDVWPKL